MAALVVFGGRFYKLLMVVEVAGERRAVLEGTELYNVSG